MRFIISIILTILVWLALKHLLKKVAALSNLEEGTLQIKYNRRVFRALLSEQAFYGSPDPTCALLRGPADAEAILTVITDPTCPACAKVSETIEEFLKQSVPVQFRIMYKVRNNEGRNIAMKILELSADNHYATAQASKKLEAQIAWCQQSSIPGTPVVLLDGYRLPQAYSLEDIRWLL